MSETDAEKGQNKKVQNSVTVVYDGNAPFVTAKNICRYLQSMGYRAKLMDADGYHEDELPTGYEKVIIIGHHTLAKKLLQDVGIRYDNMGMKYGFSPNRCVLIVSRAELGRGNQGRAKFRKYYNMRMSSYEEFADKYGIPMIFGSRDETRESQYDLLLLEFIAYGLPEFLQCSDNLKGDTD